MAVKIVDATLDNVLDYGLCGYKDSKKHPGLRLKMAWLKDRFAEGLKVKILYADEGGTQGMIEYIPGEYAWRPVEAAGYMFIHCIFVGLKRDYKNKGFGRQLVEAALKDAKEAKMSGVAVVTRRGSFMADKTLFVKMGFEVVDKASPDFELLVKKFDKAAVSPRFKPGWPEKLKRYQGLAIIQSDQCPYIAKCVPEMIETAKAFGIEPQIVEISTAEDAQNSPCGFGMFGIIYDGEVIAEHMISNTRFRNIISKKLKSQ